MRLIKCHALVWAIHWNIHDSFGVVIDRKKTKKMSISVSDVYNLFTAGVLAFILPLNLLELREKLPPIIHATTEPETETAEETKEEPLTISNFL